MTIAVFYYAPPKKMTPEDVVWLQLLLQALAAAGTHHRLLVFSNVLQQEVSKDSIDFPEWKVPQWVMVRKRSLRLWQKAARQAGAEAILCIGPQSWVQSELAAFLLLPPANKWASKELQQWKAAASGVWVTNEKEHTALKQLGIESVTTLRGGPLLAGTEALNADALKEQHTDGCEFFLCAGPITATEPFIGLLKAFSRFKHRQKSSWKLVILQLGDSGPAADALRQAIATYKYRNEVVMPKVSADECQPADFFSAAYAFVQPAAAGAYGQYLPDALRAGLPVIAASNPLHKEIAGDAALYYEAGDEQSLGDCLMMVYKDEALHGRLAAAARENASRISWAETATTAWQALEASMK